MLEGAFGLRIEKLEGRDAFNALERDWNAALAQAPRDEPMLRHEWLRAWIENFAPSAPLRVFAAREGRQLVAALPLVELRERSADTCFLPLTTWALPCNDHSQRGGMLLGARGRQALPSLFARLASEPGWDRLQLRDLPEGAPEWHLKDLAEEQGYPCGVWVSLRSPYLLLPAAVAAGAGGGRAKGKPAAGKPEDGKQPKAGDDPRYAELEARIDAKFRANLRRRRRRLAELGALEYRVLDGKNAAELDCALADFYAIESSGWKGREGTAIAQRPELVGFYTQLASDAARRGALALGLLASKGKPIAAHLSVLHAGRAYLLKLGYDEALREHSPGQQLAADALRDACARGLSEFDFLGPDMAWKDDWEPALRTHAWLTIFRPTKVGRLVHGARYTAWPVARSLWRRLRPKALEDRAGACKER
jgi:CelD/BcsL family acetyltransferase involved in cellulose biosynthesis